MKRERSEDDDVNDDARAPGSPPRGLEREKKIQKSSSSFLESSKSFTTTTVGKKIFVLSLSKINHVLLRLQNDSDDDDR